jgi:hypothetical protein
MSEVIGEITGMTIENFVVCISNEGYQASLENRKIYEVISDAEAGSRHYIRVVDESGEDYMYPEKLFLAVSLPENERAALHHA